MSILTHITGISILMLRFSKTFRHLRIKYLYIHSAPLTYFRDCGEGYEKMLRQNPKRRNHMSRRKLFSFWFFTIIKSMHGMFQNVNPSFILFSYLFQLNSKWFNKDIWIPAGQMGLRVVGWKLKYLRCRINFSLMGITLKNKTQNFYVKH